MPIFLNSSSKIICQGVPTERQIFELHQSISYGSKILAFVQAGKGGSSLINLPIFNTVRDAFKQTKADVSLIYSDGNIACNDIVEAIDSEIPLIIAFTRNMPLHDLVEVSRILSHHPRSSFLGPKIFGIITPGQSKIGSLPGFVFSPGPAGFISSAESLGCAIAMLCTREGIGQSTFVGVLGMEFGGMSATSIAEKFVVDEQTRVMVYIADISKGDVSETIETQKRNGKKPMVLYAPGAGLAAFESPTLTIVPDMTQVIPAVKKYLLPDFQHEHQIIQEKTI